jgi:hypothetical protein
MCTIEAWLSSQTKEKKETWKSASAIWHMILFCKWHSAHFFLSKVWNGIEHIYFRMLWCFLENIDMRAHTQTFFCSSSVLQERKTGFRSFQAGR